MRANRENLKAVLVTTDAALSGACSAAFLEAGVGLESVREPRAFRNSLAAGFDALIIDAETAGACPELAEIGAAAAWFRSAYPDKILIVAAAAPTTPAAVAALINLGANDVALKPPGFRVMAQQIKALARFLPRRAAKRAGRLSVGGGAVAVDTAARRCYVAREGAKPAEVKLTKNEFRILSLLVSKKGGFAAWEEFRGKLWPEKASAAEIRHRLLQHVADLRKKLGPQGRRIESVRGEGYRMRDDVVES